MGLFQPQHITENNENAIEEILTYNNFNRTRKLSIILFLANIFILFIDYINKVDGLWIINAGYKYLFYSHVVLGLGTLLYILVSYRIIAHSANDITLSHKFYAVFFAFFILSLTAVISGWIDQTIHGQITVYVIGCFIIAVMYSYKPKVSVLLYGLSGVVFMISLTITQYNPTLRQANFLNASLLVVISYFLSTVLEWHNINDIVTSTLPLVQADAQNNDNLLTVELNNVPDLQLNIQEIRQLLLNLVRNGFEAMSSGGQLRIRTFSTNSEVALVVSDEGKGIEQYIMEKLGTPFFTTKEQGTGLGLAVCYGIVLRHNGRINVETSPKGSTFYVYFELNK